MLLSLLAMLGTIPLCQLFFFHLILIHKVSVKNSFRPRSCQIICAASGISTTHIVRRSKSHRLRKKRFSLKSYLDSFFLVFFYWLTQLNRSHNCSCRFHASCPRILTHRGEFAQGITTYDYILAVREQGLEHDIAEGEGFNSLTSSPASSNATGVSGYSSAGALGLHRGVFCTPPRMFVEHQQV